MVKMCVVLCAAQPKSLTLARGHGHGKLGPWGTQFHRGHSGKKVARYGRTHLPLSLRRQSHGLASLSLFWLRRRITHRVQSLRNSADGWMVPVLYVDRC